MPEFRGFINSEGNIKGGTMKEKLREAVKFYNMKEKLREAVKFYNMEESLRDAVKWCLVIMFAGIVYYIIGPKYYFPQAGVKCNTITGQVFVWRSSAKEWGKLE
jgi:hypothetical protein